VIGLGEAGAAIARDLREAGASVTGYDPAVSPGDGIERAGSAEEAARAADVVLSVKLCRGSRATSRPRSPLRSHRTRSSPTSTRPRRGAKREVAEIVGRGRGRFADVALMAPVAGPRPADARARERPRR